MSRLYKWVLIFLAMIIVFLFIRYMVDSPRASQLSEATTDHSEEVIPEHFWKFYRQFHTDSIYQMQAIQFPLEGIIKQETKGLRHKWVREQWKMHRKPENLAGFDISYAHYGSLIEEVIEDRTAHFRMLRRFSQKDTSWTLIFYEEMGPKIN